MDETLAYAISWLRRDYKAYCQQELLKLGVSMGQLYFLLYIGKYQPCSSKVLAEALLVDAGQTTRSVDKLVEAGLVSREKSATDKRSVQLTLTAQGEHAYLKSRQLFQQWDELALVHLKPAEAQIFMTAMQKIVQGRQQEQADRQEE